LSLRRKEAETANESKKQLYDIVRKHIWQVSTAQQTNKSSKSDHHSYWRRTKE